MESLNAEMSLNVVMKNGKIAEACEPLGVIAKCGEVEIINYSDRAIAAAGSHNSVYLSVVEHLLHIGESLFIGSCKLMRRGINVLT